MAQLSYALLAGATFFGSLPSAAVNPIGASPERGQSIVIERERPSCGPLTPEEEQALMDFSESESLAAIARFGCDCPQHIAAVRCLSAERKGNS